MASKIKVLAVDDSALIRELLKEIVNSDKELEMVATAANPVFAERKIAQFNPDVLTLDIEMPQMDGITFLRKIMKEDPRPVIIFSSLLDAHRELTLDALAIGAFDYMIKPKVNIKEGVGETAKELIEKIKGAYRNRGKLQRMKKESVTPSPILSPKAKAKPAPAPQPKPAQRNGEFVVTEKFTADVILSYNESDRKFKTPQDPIIAVGASTGGTEAIVKMLQACHINMPPMVIVQHMPEYFTLSFANRLNNVFDIEVREAVDGNMLTKGLCLIAPGGKHTLVKVRSGRYYVEVRDGPPVNRHKPSVDVLFRSVAKYAKEKAVGIILTGMGNDGAQGMLEMHEAGAYNIAQDEQSCVVFGMPKEAIAKGGVDKTLPVERVLEEALRVAK